jgi:hypothetical protein
MTSNDALKRRTEVGGTIDSWCGKCKRVLAHTIEAMVGDKPARVHCNTCNAQHAYKPDRVASSTVRERKSGTADHNKIASTAHPRPYSSRERYAKGDVIEHAVFGIGVATAVRDGNKVEVRFQIGSKVLVHDASV